MLRLDLMHVLDLKGVIAIAAGSLLLHLVQNFRCLGRVEQDRMDDLNAQMKEFQSRTGVQHLMPSLRIDDLRAHGWAVMGSKLVKAANSRSMVPFLAHLANKYFPAHGGFASSIRKVFRSLDAAERIFYSEGMFLSDAAKVELTDSLNCMGRHWQHLRGLSHDNHKNEWQISPKVHIAVCAIAEQALLINPRAVQNYGEESMVGRMTKIWGASANGPYRPIAQQVNLVRYLTGLNIRVTSDQLDCP